MTTTRILIIFLVSLVVKNEASRILAVFPAASLSHQVVFRPLVLELVKRGHEVVVLNTDPMFKQGEGPANLTEIDVHDLSYRIVRQEFLETTMTQGSKNDVYKQWETGFKIMLKVLEAQFSTNAMQALLKDETKSFDLLLLEAVFPSLLGLTSIYNASVIQISSFGSTYDNLKTVGASTHPLVYPTFIQQRAHTLTFWDKITELYTYFWIHDLVATYEKNSEEAMKRIFGSDLPSMTELKNKVDLLFLNIHPIWENNRPVPPNVIYMGGLHQKPEKELPQDLKEYLDSSKHGVIYVSFGTNVEPAMLPPEKIQTLIGAFTKTPYDILWKWNTDYELPGKAKNIKLSKWLPQADLLRHPKIKLFITQGGLQSTDEAITAGVPLIGIPMLADQWFNVDQYVHLKIGLGIDMETISEDTLGTAIKTIVNNDSYRVNMARIRSIMQDQPQTPLERATWWVEYVLRHGGAKHLRSPAANMQWTEYVELELISYLILGLLSVLVVLGYVTYFLYSLCFAKQRSKPKLKSN